jgi:hypothetical protein
LASGAALDAALSSREISLTARWDLLAGRDVELGDRAQDHFRRALDWAQRQGAWSWELRAATGLARMWRNQGRAPEVRATRMPNIPISTFV